MPSPPWRVSFPGGANGLVNLRSPKLPSPKISSSPPPPLMLSFPSMPKIFSLPLWPVKVSLFEVRVISALKAMVESPQKYTV